MAAAEALCPASSDTVLDLCAAPGGKSTQLSDMLTEGTLVANEIHPARARVLSANLERMGCFNAIVTCASPEKLASLWPETFDAILVDAPCSGEGMFRKNPDAVREWQPASPEGCAARQKTILECAAGMLKPGGRLAVLEFAVPENPLWRTLYLFYFKHAMRLGGRLVGSGDAYDYLVDSVLAFPRYGALCREFEAAGFTDVRYDSYSGGIAVCYSATIPTRS